VRSRVRRHQEQQASGGRSWRRRNDPDPTTTEARPTGTATSRTPFDYPVTSAHTRPTAILPGRHHAALRRAGTSVRRGVGCYSDCIPLPGPPPRRPAHQVPPCRAPARRQRRGSRSDRRQALPSTRPARPGGKPAPLPRDGPHRSGLGTVPPRRACRGRPASRAGPVVVDSGEHTAATARPAMHERLPVAGSSAALPRGWEGKALLINRRT
jgi:hypothetical protein